ncbi:MAG: M20/M25/M40 family metallo-hydrolase [Anaerovoracaceae bacterium]|jgi:dipeptidase D
MVVENEDKEIKELLGEPVTAGVAAHFEEICSIPHGSGNEKALAVKLREFLEDSGCTTKMDVSGNLSASLPAAPGCEDAPVLMFQGHLDMVCAAGDDSGYDMARDPIELRAGRDADGTPVLHTSGRSSLGADDGIGIAAFLWLFDKVADTEGGIRASKHGPLRVLLTVREEQGLLGAERTRSSLFDDVDFIVNVDGFTAGRFITASAGGRREVFEKPAEVVPALSSGKNRAVKAFEIRIRGLLGGHSGFDIDKKRINGAAFICRLLADIRDAGISYMLCSLDSGVAHNVIPSSADAVIEFDGRDEQRIRDVARASLAEARKSATEDEGTFELIEVPAPEKALSAGTRDSLIDFANSTTCGVVSYMKHFPDIVDTSCNLGRIWADPEKENTHIMFFERSIDRKTHDSVIREHAGAAEREGFKMTELAEYVAWEYDGKNPLLDTALAAYEEVTGEKGEPYAVHIGIEPSVFYGDNPDMYMVSGGTSIHDPHTVNERCEIETIAPFAKTLLEITRRVADMKRDDIEKLRAEK